MKGEGGHRTRHMASDFGQRAGFVRFGVFAGDLCPTFGRRRRLCVRDYAPDLWVAVQCQQYAIMS